MKKIEIKEPCHEKWGDFTSTQRGAFCGKCQINVIDFSTKSNDEIKKIILENSNQKMCGRFLKKQLVVLNTDFHMWYNQTQPIFQSKFIFALVLSFGLTLFSCSTKSDAKTIDTINSYFTTSLIQSVKIDSIKTDSTLTQKTTCTTDFIQGDIDIVHDDEQEIMVMGELPYEEDDIVNMVKGKIAIDSQPIKKDSTVNINSPMILGKVAPVQKDLSVEKMLSESTHTPTFLLSDKFEAELFPNPTHSQSKLKINFLAQGFYNISIYNATGQMIKTIFNGNIEPQNKQFDIDLSSQKSGLYFARITSNTQSESIKITKID